MERLEGPLADLVAAEREALEEVDKPRAAAWSGIAAAWGVGPPPAPPPGAAEAAATAAKGGAMLKIASAVVLGGAVAAAAWLSPGTDAGEAPRVVAPAEADPEPPSAPLRTPPQTAPEIAVPPPAPEAKPEPEPEPEPEPALEVPRPTKPAPAGLSEELALIDALRRDVKAGRYADALEKAKRHRDEFAAGALKADRMDLEAAAQCGSGRLEAGRRTADQKAKRWPRAPISDRLRTLCKLDER